MVYRRGAVLDARTEDAKTRDTSFAGRHPDPVEGAKMQRGTLPLRAVVLPGAAAGLVGAVSIDAYLIVTVALARHIGIVPFYQYVASGAIGKAAYEGSAGALLGAAIHLVVSLAWGIGYALVAQSTPQVRAQPLVSGAVFGVVVMLAMQLVAVAANIYRLPDTLSLANALVAHVVFFGIPVAYVVTRGLGRVA